MFLKYLLEPWGVTENLPSRPRFACLGEQTGFEGRGQPSHINFHT